MSNPTPEIQAIDPFNLALPVAGAYEGLRGFQAESFIEKRNEQVVQNSLRAKPYLLDTSQLVIDRSPRGDDQYHFENLEVLETNRDNPMHVHGVFLGYRGQITPLAQPSELTASKLCIELARATVLSPSEEDFLFTGKNETVLIPVLSIRGIRKAKPPLLRRPQMV